MVAVGAQLEVLDGPAVRRWAATGLAALAAAAEEIDRLNVFPVPDSDTGTNLVHTLSAAIDALTPDAGPAVAQVWEGLARGALVGACGNSGTILAQLLHGLADAAHQGGAASWDPSTLAWALERAAGSARSALARPVDGTVLTVADAVAAGAAEAATAGADLGGTVQAAAVAGRLALAATPGQLAALHGRVDAGGQGLLVLIEALAAVVAGSADPVPIRPLTTFPSAPVPGALEVPGGPGHEVMYLLDTTARDQAGHGAAELERVADLRAVLDAIGESVLVVGGRGLWHVHVHTDDIGAAVEAGFVAGRPHDVRIVRFADQAQPPAPAGDPAGGGPALAGAVIAIVEGAGLADLLTAAGARVLDPASADAAGGAALSALVADLLPGSAHVTVLPASARSRLVAERVADEDGRVRVIACRSAIQVIAALAVHDATREVAADLIAMATAAAGCRDGLVEIAEGDGVTSAGRCRAGDVLGHIDGDVAVIGRDLEQVAGAVLDGLLGGGGELVTLVAGAPAEPGLAERVAAALHRRRPDVDVTTYDGGQPSSYLLVGVE